MRAHPRCGRHALSRCVSRTLLLAGFLVGAAMPQFAPAAPGAAGQVRQGIRHFEAKEFDRAAEAFDSAGKALPGDPRVAFDRATAYAAKGRYDEATALFQQAALARDADLALRSRYNLAGVAVARARRALGTRPEEAAPRTREEAIGWLGTALAHYRDVLQLDPHHADARHNIELIRIWTQSMQARWRRRDQEKNRQQPLAEYLRWLENQQRILRTRTAGCQGKPPSTELRAELDAVAGDQSALAEEIEPLRAKIAAELGAATATASSGSASAQPPLAASPEAIAALQEQAAEAGRAMVAAGQAIAAEKPGEAVAAQASAVELLDGIAAQLLPFGSLVHQAIERQQQEIDRVAPAVEKPDPAHPLAMGERAWEERFITRWSQRLAELARAGVQQAATASAAVPKEAPETAASGNGEQTAMEKAVRLAPQVVALSGQAADALQASHPADALPKQREALRLLKEMAESLPPQKPQPEPSQCENPKSGDNAQPSQSGDSQKKEEEEEEEEEEEGKKREEPQPPEAKPAEGKEASPPAQQASPSKEPPKSPDRQAQPRKGELTPEEAEALLRRVRQRTAERLEAERQLRRYRYVPDPVEKDW